MKLRNKKTGEIGNVNMAFSLDKFTVEDQRIETNSNPIKTWEYTSLTELNEEWEDYTKPENLSKNVNNEERGLEDE